MFYRFYRQQRQMTEKQKFLKLLPNKLDNIQMLILCCANSVTQKICKAKNWQEKYYEQDVFLSTPLQSPLFALFNYRGIASDAPDEQKEPGEKGDGKRNRDKRQKEK